MNRFQPHLEILPPNQRMMWPQLASLSSLGFVLYGGTAIGLRLGHRASVDFDFFSSHALDRHRLSDAVNGLRDGTVLQDESNAWTVLVGSEPPRVKLSFFGALRLGQIKAAQRTDDGILDVASLDDLFGMKLAVITQRVEPRDYEDVAAILRSGYSLEYGLGCARALYGSQFAPPETVKALTYFQGADFRLLTDVNRDLLVAAANDVREITAVPLLNEKICTAAS